MSRDQKVMEKLWAHVVTTAWGEVPNGTLSMMFTCCPNLMFLASLWLEIYRFSNWSFCYFEQFKVDIHFANFMQVRIDPNCSLLLTLDWSQSFYWVWVRHIAKTIQCKSSVGAGTSYFQWFNQWESRTGVCSQ